MLEKLQAEVDGQKIFYLQKGKQGLPIIFIHGVEYNNEVINI